MIKSVSGNVNSHYKWKTSLDGMRGEIRWDEIEVGGEDELDEKFEEMSKRGDDEELTWKLAFLKVYLELKYN